MVKGKYTFSAPGPFDTSKAASTGPVPFVPIRRAPEKRAYCPLHLLIAVQGTIPADARSRIVGGLCCLGRGSRPAQRQDRDDQRSRCTGHKGRSLRRRASGCAARTRGWMSREHVRSCGHRPSSLGWSHRC